MPAEPQLTRVVAKFVKHHLADKQAFAAFTGQDRSAWCAFLYAVELWGRGDRRGQTYGLDGMKALMFAAQQTSAVLVVFQKSIPGVLDWSYETSLWPQIAPVDKTGAPIFYAPIGERLCAHLYSKPSKKHAGYLNCKDCGVTWQSANNAEGAVSP